MEKLDLKGRKILYELDINSRQSFSQLGRKVGLHKDVVAYRVRKLQEREIIKNFYTEINDAKLAFSEIKFYLSFQNTSPEIRQKIINYLVKNQYTDIIHSLEGQYDLVVISSEKNIAKFNDIWTHIINKFRDYISNQVFCIESLSITFKKTFLLGEKADKKEDRFLCQVSANDEIVKLDNLDYKILELLSSNSRVNTIELAKTLKSSFKTINSRIKRLVKIGVIRRYTININWPIIGYQWYKADVVLKDSNKKQQILEYVKHNPNLLYWVTSIGYVDFELIFILNNLNQLYSIIDDISSKFPDTIKSFKYFTITKTHKFYGMDFWKRK